MNNLFYVVVLFSIIQINSIRVEAQSEVPDTKLLITNHTYIGGGVMSTLDNYLSDLPYEGTVFQFRNTGRRLLRIENSKSLLRSDVDFKIGVFENKPATATMSFTSLNVGVGLQYQLQAASEIKLLMGGLWDLDFAVRRSSREVNNNQNVDLSTNLNIATTLKYDIPLFNNPIRLLLDVKSPILGLMFVPQRGASYYEIFMLNNLEDVGHFSSIFNKNALNAQFIFQIPIKNFVFEIGLQSDWMRYRANNVFVKHCYYGLQVGLCYDFNFFGGGHSETSRLQTTEW